jgi:outer membrane protein assembly factor BamA
VGSYLGTGLTSYIDPDGTYSFNLVDVEGVQHLPLLRETWVVSLRARVQTTVDDDDVVPYFLMPALGSSSTLRAYSSRRFRDRHSVVASAEWRWIPNRLGMDMALFVDAGKVTSRRAALNLSGLEHNAGIGLRLHGPSLTVIRIELARGSEGWNTVFSSSAAF